jgi:hypothetical protein
MVEKEEFSIEQQKTRIDILQSLSEVRLANI